MKKKGLVSIRNLPVEEKRACFREAQQRYQDEWVFLIRKHRREDLRRTATPIDP